MADLIAPSTGNLQIGKANIYFTPVGHARRHIGNVPTGTFELAIDKLDHFSSMSGIKKKDFSATLSVTGTLTLSLEEMNVENLALAMLGDTPAADNSTEGDGNIGFIIGEVESVTGRIEVIGSNDVGPRYTYDFPSVTFTPSKAVDFIGEDFTALELTGDVLAVTIDGKVGFGKAILQTSGT